MQRAQLIPLGAGVVAALLHLSVTLGSPGAFMLAYFAQAPIVATGLVLVSLVSLLQNVAMMFAAMIVLGFGLNAFFVVSQVFVANTFGRQHIGAIRGVMQTVNNLATFGGPWLFGVIYDVSAEYMLLFGIAVVFWVITITMASLVRPLARPKPSEP